MMKRHDDSLQVLLDDTGLALDEMCRLAAVTEQWLAERVAEGLVPAQGGDGPAAWRFDAPALRRVRCMARLEQRFDAVPELAALVADLEDEIARLKARLRRRGFEV